MTFAGKERARSQPCSFLTITEPRRLVTGYYLILLGVGETANRQEGQQGTGNSRAGPMQASMSKTMRAPGSRDRIRAGDLASQPSLSPAERLSRTSRGTQTSSYGSRSRRLQSNRPPNAKPSRRRQGKTIHASAGVRHRDQQPPSSDINGWDRETPHSRSYCTV
jgi:hypothetical protein